MPSTTVLHFPRHRFGQLDHGHGVAVALALKEVFSIKNTVVGIPPNL
jgi:hypothetical protein